MNSLTEENNIKRSYFFESREYLNSVESSLLAMKKNGINDKSFNNLIRAAHGINVNSGMFGFDLIGDFTFILENVLISVKNILLDDKSDMTGLLLECHDFIQELIYHYETDEKSQLNDEMDMLFKSLGMRLNYLIPCTI